MKSVADPLPWCYRIPEQESGEGQAAGRLRHHHHRQRLAATRQQCERTLEWGEITVALEITVPWRLMYIRRIPQYWIVSTIIVITWFSGPQVRLIENVNIGYFSHPINNMP